MPDCPKCDSQEVWVNGYEFMCDECGHTWSKMPISEDERGDYLYHLRRDEE